MKKSVAISDIFFSIQGEGKNIGKPFIFIRFALCNLSCDWCDTKYSWHKDFLDFKICEISELLQNIKTLSSEKCCKNILFTGGEPLLHQNAICEIMRALPTYFFEIETNGSIETTLPFDQINVSYKLKNAKTRIYGLQILPHVQHKDIQNKNVQSKDALMKNIQHKDALMKDIQHEDTLRKNVSYKFVISHENDILEALNICGQYKIPLRNVYFMPEGIRREVIRERGKWLKKRCGAIGVRFTPRLHILLWGNKRGV